MRKIYYLLILFFSFSVLSAQEELSKEEKARREKNIQAGNPFAKYGSKAPVATLSKGKYLEVHDLDSIVTIGTSRWNVDNKKIVGDIIIDSLNVDAQPIGDRVGRWMSPDPLSEEFPSWSPYNMSFNNPIRFVDPDGRAPYDHIFSSSGKFIKDTGVGNAVKIQIGGKLYTPSQLDNSVGSNKTIAKIGAYYAREVGVSAGTKIGTGKGSEASSSNPAFTTGKDNVARLNNNGGFSKSLDNIDNFKNIIKHENLHQQDNSSGNQSNLSTHADVYLGQFGDKSFTNTTPDFKIGTISSFTNYLLNMDQSNDYGQNEIMSKINSFNALNTGYQINGPIGNFAKGTLSLQIQNGNNTYDAQYKKIENEN